MLSGCIDTGFESKIDTAGELVPEKLIKINYVDNDTILNGEDFPDFKLMDNVYYIAPENLSLTLETEMGHGVYEIDANTTILPGYRTYGESEVYNSSENNSSERYILLQYKVFDNNESLNDTIDMTARDIYAKRGYRYKPLNSTYGRVVMLESNATNHTDMNIIIVLFGFDTVIGKIGVQDLKNKSLNESLKILEIVFDRIHVRTKEVRTAKLSGIRSSNMSKNMSSNMSKMYQ